MYRFEINFAVASAIVLHSHARDPAQVGVNLPIPLVRSSHCRAVGWVNVETEEQQAELKEAQTAFKAIAATWRPIEMTVDSGCVGVFEDVPFMHIPHSASQIFWRSEARASDLIRDEPKPPPSYLSLLLEVIATFLLPVLLILLAVALRGPKHYFQLPGKPQP